MQKIIIIFSVLAMLLLREECHGQSGSVRYTAGINYTVGVPTFVPQGNVSRVAIDTGTMKWYEYAQVGGWRWSGDRVQDISGCAAPAYTPGKAQSRLVLNSCTEAQNGRGPELYKYTGSTWLCLNCGGNYTAGDGIDITGAEITNTAPDQVVSIIGAGINAVTGTYPNFTVTGTEVDGSTTNELQTLSVAGSNLSISGGNTVTLPTPSSTLDALSDVTITTPSNNQILQYNTATTQWVNATLSAITGSIANGRVAFGSGTAITGSSNLFWDNTVKRLGVNTTSPQSGIHVTGTSSTFSQVTSGVGLQGISSGSGLITAVNYTPTNPSHNTISAGASFGLNGSSNNFYGLGLADLRASSYDMWFQTGSQNGGGYRFYSSTTTGGELTERVTISKSGQLGVNSTTPSVSAIIEAASTTQGVLFPRMTGTQRDAIASPPDGLVVYNTTAAKLQVRAASAWVDLH